MNRDDARSSTACAGSSGSTDPTSAQFDVRLARLERDSRRWRLSFVAAVALLALVVATGASPGPAVPDVLAAQSFSLVDGDGNVRGLWRMGAGGAEFAAFEADGSVAGVLTIVGGAVTAPAPLPHPNSETGGSRIKLGPPPEGAGEADDDFDWAD